MKFGEINATYEKLLKIFLLIVQTGQFAFKMAI